MLLVSYSYLDRFGDVWSIQIVPMFELDNLKIYFLTRRLQTQICHGKRHKPSELRRVIRTTEIKGPFWVLQIVRFHHPGLNDRSRSLWWNHEFQGFIFHAGLPSKHDPSWPDSTPVKHHLHFAIMAWPSCRGSRISLESRRPMWSTWINCGMIHVSQSSWTRFHSKFVSCS